MAIRTWLVQRLVKPFPKQHTDTPLGRLANAFSFGGGMVNGGMSKEAMAAISEIFRFDYMGAAEYEFGDVPKAFAALAELRKNGQLCCFKVAVTGSKAKDEHTVVPARHDVWFFSADTPEMRQYCTLWIVQQLEGRDAPREVQTRDRTHIQERLNPRQSDLRWRSSVETIGGIALGNNPFCYFMDVEPSRKFAELLGLECPEPENHDKATPAPAHSGGKKKSAN